ncbi:hypothetical protein [Metallibacterium sp.]|uniref:Lipoprotein n=1 Tax=mine drainage metagenome TaxID=410659 RepID=T1B5G6_9ZZZZ|nr:hypothetical protein [Metallibacterium sp.]
MRKILMVAALGLGVALSLGGCHKKEAAVTQQVATVQRPTSPTDIQGWQAYLSQVVQNNMQGVSASSPYVYFVPAGTDAMDVAERQRQLEQVQGVVARTVLPGNMLAFGGPDSALTAKMIEDSFTGAVAGSFKGVTVLFIGDKADDAAVQKAVAPTSATYKFVQM